MEISVIVTNVKIILKKINKYYMSSFRENQKKAPSKPATGFKSIAQRDKMEQLVKDGKLSQETFNKWEQATPKNLTLPMKLPNLKKIKKLPKL